MNQVFGPPVPAVLAAGTATASAPIFDLSQTWNNVAVTFTGFKINITDTNSAAASLLMDLQVGGATKFNVTKDGFLWSGAVTYTGSYAGNNFAMLLRQSGGNVAKISLNLSSGIRLSNAVVYAWGVNDDATSASDTGFTRKAAGVSEVSNGSKGSYTGTAFGSGSQTVAQLPTAANAGKGARSFVTDANATTYASVVAGGGANNVPVYSDGTNWLIG